MFVQRIKNENGNVTPWAEFWPNNYVIFERFVYGDPSSTERNFVTYMATTIMNSAKAYGLNNGTICFGMPVFWVGSNHYYATLEPTGDSESVDVYLFTIKCSEQCFTARIGINNDITMICKYSGTTI